MRKAKALLGLFCGCAILAVGQGCALLDPWEDEFHLTDFRSDPPPPTRTPAEVTTGAGKPTTTPTAPGIYAEGDHR